MSQQHTIGRVHTSIKKDKITNEIVVRYHHTEVVKFDDSCIILNNGGYYTTTTKTRMNQASNQFDLGYKVHQVKGNWYVEYKGQTFPFNNEVLAIVR